MPNKPDRNAEALGKALDELIEERDELYRQFDLQWAVTCEAVEAWRADTNNHEVLPDYQRLVRWLLDERDVYAMAAERWWRQARDNNQDAWKLAKLATDWMDRAGEAEKQRDELRAEVEQYKWLLEQAKTLREDNMKMREALEAVSNDYNSYADAIARFNMHRIAREALQTIGETVEEATTND